MFKRQRDIGLLPDSAELSPITPLAGSTSQDGKPWSKFDVARRWGSASEDERRLFRRMAEVYAGLVSHADD